MIASDTQLAHHAPSATRYLYRFIAGDPGFRSRTELYFDDLDTIIDVIKADIATYEASERVPSGDGR